MRETLECLLCISWYLMRVHFYMSDSFKSEISSIFFFQKIYIVIQSDLNLGNFVSQIKVLEMLDVYIKRNE